MIKLKKAATSVAYYGRQAKKTLRQRIFCNRPSEFSTLLRTQWLHDPNFCHEDLAGKIHILERRMAHS